MANLTSKDNLTIRAAHLYNAAPREFESFLEALRAFSTNEATICIGSSLEVLPTNQGRAQMTAHLVDLLANCRTSAGKITERNS